MGRDDVQNNWQFYWIRHKDTITSSEKASPIFFEINKIVKEIRNKKYLECGSGIGEISITIAEEGGTVYMLDTSIEALKISEKFFSDRKLSGNFIHASIFDIPFENNLFDVVWNAGVLEHFKFDDQVTAIKEMSRVCKNDGLIITFNPYSKAIFYRIGKFFAEKKGVWEFGEEYPVKTFKKQTEVLNLEIVNEYSFFFEPQITFIKYASNMLFYVIKFLYKLTGKVGEYIWKYFFGGYLLVTIIKKRNMLD